MTANNNINMHRTSSIDTLAEAALQGGVTPSTLSASSSLLSLINNNNINMHRTSSIDTLAEAARQGGVAPTTLSASSSLLSLINDTSSKLAAAGADPNLIAAMARRSSSMSGMTPSASGPVSQGLPNNGNNDHAIYLSILNEQRRRSMTELRSSVSAGSMPMSTPSAAGIVGVPHQAHQAPNQAAGVGPAAGVSAASNYASMMQTQFDSTVTAPSRRRKPNFAEKLHGALTNKECRHAIAWLPSGRSFCITDQDEFVKKILPKFFRVAKFESFSRRLKRWGFRKVYTTGLSQIIFSHDLFHRDRPDLCKIMNGREKIEVEDNLQDMAAPNGGGAGGPFAPQGQDQYCNAMMFQQAQQFQQQAALQQRMALQQQMSQHQHHASMLAVAARQHSSGPASPIAIGGNSPQSSMHSLQSTLSNALPRLATSSPSKSSIDTRAVLKEALAIMSRSMPQVANDPQAAVNANDPSTIHVAKMQLTRLNDDIASCEEQLVILQQLKELKDKRRQLTGAGSPRGFSPSTA